MSTSLDSVGKIGSVITASFTNVPTALNNSVQDIVENARTFVQNYTGDSIDSNSIADKYQSAITNIAKSDFILLLTIDPSTNTLSLSDLTVGKTDSLLSAEQYRALGEMSLKALGRKIQYAKSLS